MLLFFKALQYYIQILLLQDNNTLEAQQLYYLATNLLQN